MDIRQDIQKFLDRSGWKPAHLAREAGIHPILISRILRGKRKGLNSKTLQKLWPFLYGDTARNSETPDP